MAGSVISAVRKRLINFASLGSGASQELVLADMVNVFGWRESTMLLRIHSHNIAAGAGTITIHARAQSVSAEDPGLEFVDRVTGASEVLNNLTPSPGLLLMYPLITPLVHISAVGNRTAAGGLSATISIEFSLKDAPVQSSTGGE
jgi:hypothetical protein